MRIRDKLSSSILGIIEKSKEPLETTEIIELVHDTRVRILYRLHMLRGDSLVNGKQVGSGKGVWIWWKIEKS